MKTRIVPFLCVFFLMITGLVVLYPVFFFMAGKISGKCHTVSFVMYLALAMFLLFCLVILLVYGVLKRKPITPLIIEFALVVLFLFLVSAIVIPNFTGAIERGKQKGTMATIHAMGMVIDAIRVDLTQYPNLNGINELNDLAIPVYAAVEFSEIDAWGFSYVLKSDETGYWIISYGLCGEPDVESLELYVPGTRTNRWEGDSVYHDGCWIQWQEGLQTR